MVPKWPSLDHHKLRMGHGENTLNLIKFVFRRIQYLRDMHWGGGGLKRRSGGRRTGGAERSTTVSGQSTPASVRRAGLGGRRVY